MQTKLANGAILSMADNGVWVLEYNGKTASGSAEHEYFECSELPIVGGTDDKGKWCIWRYMDDNAVSKHNTEDECWAALAEML